MPCYHPLRAYQLSGGGVTFKSANTHDGNPLDLPCGQCLGCRLQRASDWALRCVHEAQLHQANAYITLTYSDENLPPNNSLNHRDFQLFMKRLRKYANSQLLQDCIGVRGYFPRQDSPSQTDTAVNLRSAANIKYYMCGEYGDLTKRPHYHACIFNWSPPEQTYHSRNANGDKLYTSPILTKLWPLGHSLVGEVTLQSAGYCARYILQKVTGDAANTHYQDRTPEYNRMSLGGRQANGGVGAAWLAKFRSDVFPCDYIVDRDGRKHRVPRYYDTLNGRVDSDALDHVKALRELRGADPKSRSDNTPSRLRDKEVVKAAATRQLVRPDI